MAPNLGVSVEADLLEVCKLAQVENFQQSLIFALNIRRLDHMNHVKDKELQAVGLSLSQIQSLRSASCEIRKLSLRRKKDSELVYVRNENLVNNGAADPNSAVVPKTQVLVFIFCYFLSSYLTRQVSSPLLMMKQFSFLFFVSDDAHVIGKKKRRKRSSEEKSRETSFLHFGALGGGVGLVTLYGSTNTKKLYISFHVGRKYTYVAVCLRWSIVKHSYLIRASSFSAHHSMP
ncbi:unnamed protein product [Heligmosomoides polygyrus]|uniref:non-specific protein-tyrosine kinase n=1 Tax=Heligmosomoides polygyrus TaxID=6339 RepID=A0A183FAI8_HELPZ|nr:unnamed protein product [Heligmosomoides polygyrus]